MENNESCDEAFDREGGNEGSLEDLLMMALPSGMPLTSSGGDVAGSVGSASCGSGKLVAFHSVNNTGVSCGFPPLHHQHPANLPHEFPPPPRPPNPLNLSATPLGGTGIGRRCYWCHLCKREFPFPSKLNEHMRTHTGEKPFACPVCPFRTSLKWNLKSHMVRHQDVLPGYKSVV